MPFEYRYSTKFNEIHYFDSKWDHLLKHSEAFKALIFNEIEALLRFGVFMRRSSVCSIGVVVVRNGEITEITDKFYSLINPFPNDYEDWATDIHGLTREDTDSAPIFPDVWEKIEPLIKGLPLLEHNKQFD